MGDGYATDRDILGPAMISFPQLFQPSQKTGKYEVDVIYEEGSKTHKKIKKMEKQALDARWGSKLPGKLLLLVQDGDEKTNGEGDVLDGYAGMLYSKVRTNTQPRVVDVDNNPIEDPMEVRGGDKCIVLAHAYAYDNTEWKKKGVLLTLHGVRKLKDGEALGNSVNAADEMAGYEADTGDEEF
jgi:hypothetical protein